MNPLIDKLPTKIKIDDEVYEIDPDFRNCIRIIEAYEDDELTIQEKHLIMVKRLYKTIPTNLEQAIIKGVKFLNCGEEQKDIEDVKRTYSFQKDGKYIYSAINQSQHVDLSKVDFMHFWKFCYLFLDVGKDTTFSQIISLRHRKNKHKLTKEERNIFMESREILDLDYTTEESEKVSEFMRLFNGGDDLRNQKTQ